MSYDIEARLSWAEELLAAAHDYLQDYDMEDSRLAKEIVEYFERYGEEENV